MKWLQSYEVILNPNLMLILPKRMLSWSLGQKFLADSFFYLQFVVATIPEYSVGYIVLISFVYNPRILHILCLVSVGWDRTP